VDFCIPVIVPPENTSPMVETRQITSYSNKLRGEGMEIVTADTTMAEQLALTRGPHVVGIRHVRLADGVSHLLR
jgi:hypothetical protein